MGPLGRLSVGGTVGRSPRRRQAGNFRDLNGAVIRMATLAPGGRISVETVDGEIARLKASWRTNQATEGENVVDDLLGPERSAELDRFDRAQLACVLKVCREARSLSDAGRLLFGASRGRKKTVNDADRLRKYLARFNLDWQHIKDSHQDSHRGPHRDSC